MPGERDRLSQFLGKTERLTKEDLRSGLTELIRAKDESFLNVGARYVKAGGVDVRSGVTGLWTDGASVCTALAVVGTNKVFLAHLVKESSIAGEVTLLRTLDKPIGIAMATVTGSINSALESDKKAVESSILMALDIIEQGFPTLAPAALASLTTVITGYAGRDWVHECVLAAQAYSGIGFFMGAGQEDKSLSETEQWRRRSNSYNGGQKPARVMKGFKFKKQ